MINKNAAKFFLFSVFCFLLATFFACGCGGGLFNGGTAGAGSGINRGGAVTFNFNSGAGKYIASNTSSLYISITGEGLASATTKTAAYNSSGVTFDNLPLGNKTAQLISYDSNGTALAAGRGEFTIQPGKTSYVAIYMGVVITDSSITPSTFTAPPNTTVYFYNAGTRNHQLIGTSPFTTNIISAGSSQALLFSSSGINTYYLDSATSGISGAVFITGGPQITRINPAYGKASDIITIMGTNFGSSQGSSTVSFNGVNASNIISWSATKIVCRAPAGVSTGNVTVTVNGIASTSAAFTVTQTTRSVYVAANAIVPVITSNNNTVATNIAGFTVAVGAAVAPSGDYVYIADMTANSVSVIRISDNTVVAAIPGIISAMNLAVTPDGAYVYVNGGSDIKVIRTSDNTVIKTITGATTPDRMCATPDGAYVYVVDNGTNSVRVIRTSDNTFTANIGVGTGPTGAAITPDGSYVYVANNGNSTISVIRTSDNAVVSTFSIAGVSPAGIAITPAADYLYITDSPSDRVVVVRLSDNAVAATITTGGAGASPSNIAIAPDGNYAYAANAGANNMAVIRLADNIVYANINLGTGANVPVITP